MRLRRWRMGWRCWRRDRRNAASTTSNVAVAVKTQIPFGNDKKKNLALAPTEPSSTALWFATQRLSNPLFRKRLHDGVTRRGWVDAVECGFSLHSAVAVGQGGVVVHIHQPLFGCILLHPHVEPLDRFSGLHVFTPNIMIGWK